jgi:DMSO/TMAO reductase YedYZ molybdopterin-dependent catalytic subunit
MENRRQFLKKSLGFMGGAGIFFLPLGAFVQRVYGKAKKIVLPKGTKRNSLIQKNPKSLDTRNLEITPIEDFETMGITDYRVDLAKWRLIVEGAVKEPLEFTYEEIKKLPSMEQQVLLICPGFFALHGRWKGIAMEQFLRKVQMEEGATHITFYGPEGSYEKVERFPIDEIRKGKVFLAYGVNGKPLPQKHGFPLRIVAQDQLWG